MEAYVAHMLILVGIYSILTMGQNIILGYTGIFGIGQAAFYGVGAYTSALLALKMGIPFWGGLVAGAFLAGFLGWALGLCTMRLGGDYFCIVTLGFVVIVQQILLNWEGLTRGPMGLPGIPRPEVFGFSFNSRLSFCVLVWALVFLLGVFMNNIAESRIGRAFKSIRDNEAASLAMGVNNLKFKALSVAIGSFYAGVGGVLFAFYTGYIDPTSFSVMETIIVLCMAVLGGMGSITGSILGAAVLLLMPELLRFAGVTGDFSVYRQILYGMMLVFVIIVRPQGIIGKMEFRPLSLIKGGRWLREV